MGLTITTLIENNPDNKGQLLYEHGVSFLIETDGKRILFDTGQSGDFVQNAKVLNKDLNTLDFVIISHGHYDHSGGFRKLLDTVEKVPTIMVGEEFFQPKYKCVSDGDYKYIGNSFDAEFLSKHKIPFKKIVGTMEYLTDYLILFHHFLNRTDFEKRNRKFYIRENSSYIPDEFKDEIALGIVTKKGLVVIVGCSHVGVVNILKTISERVDMPIYAVIGGTHLIDADEVRMQKTIDALKDMKIQLVAVSHCTGEEGICCLRQELKECFLFNNTGNVIEI